MISAYALFFGGFLLLGGRAADLLGRRRLFIAGTVVFSAASLLSGFAWSDESLIIFRAAQGLGAAIITPAALSILMTTFSEGRERNAALGVWGAVGAFGAVAGVLLGGVLTDLLSWEWIFYINVPVGLAALALTPLLLTESRDAQVKTFDALGAVLVTSGLVTLVFAITQANDFGWTSPETIGLFAGAGALLAAFVGWELRAKEPLVPFGIFKVKTLTAANLAGLILGTVTFSMFLMLTLYMQQVLGYSPMKTGVAYLAVAGTAILWSGVAAQLVNRVGVKPVIAAGMTLLTVALLFFTQVSVGGSYVSDLLPGFLLIGAWASRSCRSRSRRWPASGHPRRVSPPGCSTRHSRSAARSESLRCRRSRPRRRAMRSRPARRRHRLSSTASRARSSGALSSQRPGSLSRWCWCDGASSRPPSRSTRNFPSRCSRRLRAFGADTGAHRGRPRPGRPR